MKVLKYGRPLPQPTVAVCAECTSVLEVKNSEWLKGSFGSEQYVVCPVCQHSVVRPGTEYTGDF